MRLYGKKLALEKIGQFTASGRIPHALLITGADGAGKRTLADYIAMLMMCGQKTAEPCFSCNECMRVKEHIHPDVVYALQEMPLPDKKDSKDAPKRKYSVSELRQFLTGCHKVPNDADIRIYIFEQADTMNEHCQNALLKIIEEPLSFNRYIFLASDKNAILETIISRVVEVPADLPSAEECVCALTEQGIPREQASSLAQTFGGNIGRCLGAAEGNRETELLELSEKLAENICAGREYDCIVAVRALKNRSELSAVLSNLADIFGNALVIAAGGKPYGFAPSVSEKASLSYSARKLNSIYDTILELLRALDFNPNQQLISTVCCAKIFEAVEKE